MDIWDSRFAERSPMFEPLRPLARVLAGDSWPAPARLNELARDRAVLSGGGQPLRFAALAVHVTVKAADYEQRIHDEGVVPMREGSWHDFFNAAAWLTFPRIKAALNRGHVEELRARPGATRNRRRDALTLFDESGVVVCSRSPAILDGIRTFAWRRVFWEARDTLLATTQCVIVGHALYEKALSPYAGMTGHALLMDTPLASNWDAHLQDKAANALWDDIRQPHDLSPLPVLGVPGWWGANQTADFYDDTEYFRAGRRKGSGENQPDRPGAAG